MDYPRLGVPSHYIHIHFLYNVLVLIMKKKREKNLDLIFFFFLETRLNNLSGFVLEQNTMTSTQ